MKPLVSVVLPVYNARKYLKPCLEALLAQNYSNLEVVAVNDGSTDNSGAILDDFAKMYPERFKILHTPNGGVWRARKVGIAEARGKYIGFCDSDDLPMPDMYSLMVLRAEETGADITVCPFWRIESESSKILSVEMKQFGNEVLSVREDPGLLPIINTSLWNKLFRASLLTETIEFDMPPRVLEDMMFLCSVYPLCEKVAFVDKPLYQYMVRKGSAMYRVTVDELNALVKSMVQTKTFVLNKSCDKRFREICDLVAFIHLGLSFPSRLARSKEVPFWKVIRTVRNALNKHFPLYRRNQFCTLRYNRGHKNRMLKPMFALWCYKLRLTGLLMILYRFFTDVLHIEIKW